AMGQLSEWNGLAASPLDQIGSNSGGLNVFTVATSSATSQVDELGVVVYCFTTMQPTLATYSPSGGWVNLGNNGVLSSTGHYDADTAVSLPMAVITENETVSFGARSWSVAMATFYHR